MKKVKIGFIGAGFMSQIAHLPSFYSDSRVELVALSDLNKKLLEKVSKKYQIKRIYTHYKEMLSKETLDGIVLAVQRSRTELIAKDIIRKGISLLSEKPAALSYKSAKKLSDMCQKKKSIYLIGYMKQHDNGILYLKKNLDNMKLGRLKSVYYESFLGDSYGNPFEYFKNENKNYRRKNTLNKNFINKYFVFLKYLNTHCHSINLIRYLFGELKLDYSSLSHGGEGCVFLKTKNNIQIVINNQYSKSKRWIENVFINFEKGKVIVKIPTPLLKNTSAELIIENYKTGTISKPWIKWGWSFRNQANFFVDCIISSKTKKSFCVAKDCLNDLKLIETIFNK